jgi:hypothetical protein
VGPLGGVHAGGAEGVRVTTPGGRTYTAGERGGAAVGPYGGVAAGGARGAAVAGPYGSAGAFRRGGVAAGGAVAGHATRYVGPGALGAQAGYVRGGYHGAYFTGGWYRAHPVAWVAPRWRVANVWVAPTWPAVAGYCSITTPPVLYQYGSNVVIQNDVVYVNGEQAASAEQYAGQALGFADRGRQAQPAQGGEWQPLGVFGLTQGDEKVAQHIFQLAVDATGVVRGNYYDAVADNTLPVYGSVDARTQRLAWSIGDKQTTVFETGLYNLTLEETTVLVHYGKERTDQMMLVRLEQPPEGPK